MPAIKVSGFVDLYYTADNDSKDNRLATDIINLEKEKFDLNMAMISVEANHKDYRAKIVYQVGEIVRVAYKSPYTNYPLIQEAWGGMRLANNLWLDAGYFFTHIGAETVVLKDNWFSSMAIATLYEPFYQTGVRMTYDISEKTQVQLQLINGYNYLEDNNKNKSVAWYISTKPANNFTVSYAGLAGNEQDAGMPGATRIYNNLNLMYDVTDNFSLKGMFDFATQGKLTENGEATTVYGGFIAAKYAFTKELSFAVRGEIYNDDKGMLTNPIFKGLSGVTGCFEIRPNANSYIRLEGKQITMDKEISSIFADKDGKNTNSRLSGTLNFGFFF